MKPGGSKTRVTFRWPTYRHRATDKKKEAQKRLLALITIQNVCLRLRRNCLAESTHAKPYVLPEGQALISVGVLST